MVDDAAAPAGATEAPGAPPVGDVGRGARLMGSVGILLVPLAVVVGGLYMRATVGPLWLAGYYDPDYVYLLNGLAITQGETVGHADHPGASAHWLFAAVIWCWHLVAGQAPLVDDLIAAPEGYLLAIVTVLLVLVAAGAALLGRELVACGVSVQATALGQAAGVALHPVARELHRASPEPLLIALSLMAAALVVRVRRVPSVPAVVALGVVVGLALGAKITALPLALLALWAMPNVRLRFVGGGAATLVLTSLLANPLFPTSRFFPFLSELVRRDGYNTPTNPAASWLEAGAEGLQQVARSFAAADMPTALFLLAGVALAAALLRRGAALPDGLRLPKILMLGALATVAMQLVLLANGPAAAHRYFLPAAGPVALVVAFSSVALREVSAGRARGIVLPTVVFVILWKGLLIHDAVSTHQRAVDAWRSAEDWIEATAPTAPRVVTYRASSRAFALFFGNIHFGDVSRSEGYFSPQIERRFGDVHPYFRSNETVSEAGRRVPLVEFVAQRGEVLLHCMANDLPAAVTDGRLSSSVVFSTKYQWVSVLRVPPR